MIRRRRAQALCGLEAATERGHRAPAARRGHASLHTYSSGAPLLFRAGGYWWDGEAWYRPGQIWDLFTEDYARHKSRVTATVHAADMLDGHARPDRAHVHKVATFDAATAQPENWI
ncbi:hypothetical protein ACWDV7_27055 [Streptomyces sp. NPDC003362]